MCNGQRLSRDSVPCLGLLPKDAQQPGRRRRSRLGSRSGRNQRGYLSSSPDSRVLSSAARSARGSHVQLRVGVRCRCVACRFINHGPLRTCTAAAQRVATRRRSSGCCRPTGLAVAAGAWWSARPDRTHPSTHVSKPGRNPFLENGCARDSAPETDWLSRADRRHSKPNECSLQVARVWASRRSGRAGKQAAESERASERRGLHTTTGLVGLRWGSNGPQQTLSSETARVVRCLTDPPSHPRPHHLAPIRRHAISHLNHLNSHLPGLRCSCMLSETPQTDQKKIQRGSADARHTQQVQDIGAPHS